jgi:hypothetical protein
MYIHADVLRLSKGIQLPRISGKGLTVKMVDAGEACVKPIVVCFGLFMQPYVRSDGSCDHGVTLDPTSTVAAVLYGLRSEVYHMVRVLWGDCM